MGSVNRCWRCGQEFVARRANDDLPPVRRGPVVEAAPKVWVAELSDIESAACQTEVPVNSSLSQHSANLLRRGSPFGDRGTVDLETI